MSLNKKFSILFVTLFIGIITTCASLPRGSGYIDVVRDSARGTLQYKMEISEDASEEFEDDCEAVLSFRKYVDLKDKSVQKAFISIEVSGGPLRTGKNLEPKGFLQIGKDAYEVTYTSLENKYEVKTYGESTGKNWLGRPTAEFETKAIPYAFARVHLGEQDLTAMQKADLVGVRVYFDGQPMTFLMRGFNLEKIQEFAGKKDSEASY